MIKELFLYSSKNCHLCQEMQEVLDNILPKHGYTCHIIDIDADPELKHRYGARLPVLVAGNTEICEVRVDMDALQSFLLDNK